MKRIILLALFIILGLGSSGSFAINPIPQGEGVNLLPGAVSQKNINYVKDIGFNFVRTGVPWGAVEKKKSVYDWAYYDSIINLLLSNDLKPLIIIGFNNPLYGDVQTFTGISTDNQRKGLAKFAAALVNRYKGKEIVWEIWNEPSIGEFWKPRPNYQDYSKMADCIIDEVRKVAPNEIIVAPSIPIPNSGEFLDIIGKNGLFNKIDAVSFHFYPYITYENQTPEGLTIPHFVNMIKNKSNLPVISSESGWSTVWPTMNEHKQALFFARQMVINRANGINLAIWHNLKDYRYNLKDPESNFGLIRYDYTPRPSYFGVRYMIKSLKDKKFVRAVNLPSKNDYAYVFTDGKNEYLYAWTTGSPHEITINNQSFSLSEYVITALLK